MKFTRRLRLYLTGFLFGIILVIFFFGERVSVLTAWLPNNRVLQSLEDTYQGESDLAQCQINCFELDTAAISFSFDEGDVQFGMSETRSVPKMYVVDTRYEDRLIRLSFETADSLSTLVNVELPADGRACNCP
ncbi:MAG: hypothetical protein AAGC47_16430 [Bacteroidota bacterium]